MELGYEFSIKNTFVEDLDILEFIKNNVIQCRGEIYDNNKTI